MFPTHAKVMGYYLLIHTLHTTHRICVMKRLCKKLLIRNKSYNCWSLNEETSQWKARRVECIDDQNRMANNVWCWLFRLLDLVSLKINTFFEV